VINVGCCYNLLTEECSSTTGETTKDSMSGFPLSKGVRHLGLHLGKNGRDLACQVYHSSGHAPKVWNLHGAPPPSHLMGVLQENRSLSVQ
jgi:hypothetical protein